MKKFFVLALAAVLGLGAVSCNKHLEPTEFTKNDFKYKLTIQGQVTIAGGGGATGATVKINYNSKTYSAVADINGNYSIWMPTTVTSGNVNLYVSAEWVNSASGAKYTGYYSGLMAPVNGTATCNITVRQ